MLSLSSISHFFNIIFHFSSSTSFAKTLQYITSKKSSHFNSDSSFVRYMLFSVPQSSVLTITSCEESQSFLVRYHDSAVLRAVSALPFLHECAEIKYSVGFNHSTKLHLIGSSIISHFGFTTNHFIPDI